MSPYFYSLGSILLDEMLRCQTLAIASLHGVRTSMPPEHWLKMQEWIGERGLALADEENR